MHTKRRTRTGVVAVSLGLAAIAAGCGGGSSTRATPAGSPLKSAPTTVAAPAPAGVTRPPGTTAPAAKPRPSTPPTASTATKPVATPASSAAQLAAVSQDLDSAGNSLAGSNGAIRNANVSQAETQEGSAP